MYMLLFWIIISSSRLYLNQYKYIDLYMSSVHSMISPILYYNALLDDNTSVLTFSLLYFTIDTFIVNEIQYKIHHIVSLCAICTSMYYQTNQLILINCLFYAEYPVLLFNYIDYMSRSSMNIVYPIYYNILASLHLLMMIHSRVYHLGQIGYNCILYLEHDTCFYIGITVHFIIYSVSLKWVITRCKELYLDN